MSVGILIAAFVVLLLTGIICLCTGSSKKGLIFTVIALVILGRVCKMFV